MRIQTKSFFVTLLLAVFLAAGVTACDDDGGTTTDCPEEYTTCNDVCVDVQTNQDNCGECGNTCDATELCLAGTCSPIPCGGNTIACDDTCVDTNYDPNNCGECGNACGTGDVCDMGTCSTSCGGSTEACNGGCVDTQVDPANCGECGNVCPGVQHCVAGGCVGDDVAPTVVSSVPADAATGIDGGLTMITVTFSEVINPATVHAGSISVSSDLGAVSGTTTMLAGGLSLGFMPSSPVGYLENVEVLVDGAITDLAGNAMGTAHTFAFTTAPSALLLDPMSFVGSIDATQSFTLLALGDSGAVAAASPVYSIDATTVATVDAAGLVTCIGIGVATLQGSSQGMTAQATIMCGTEYGQPTTYQGSALVVDGYGITWDFMEDGTIDDGGGDRYDGMWEIEVYNLEADEYQYFPDCSATEITFDAPYAMQASPTIVENDVYNGNYSGDLGRVGGEGMAWQEVTLSATAVSLDFSFYYMYSIESYAGTEVGYSVTIEDMTGGTGETVVIENTDTFYFSNGWSQGTFDLLPWAGETVRIKFHYYGGIYQYDGRAMLIDDVSIVDDQSTEYVVNGDFEAGDSSGWNGVSYIIPREVNLAPANTVAGVNVARSIYASYDPGTWARYLDTYTNDGTETVTLTVYYYGDLGSDDAGVIYTAAGGRAYLEYDEDGDPPLGVIPGTAASVDIPSYSEYWEVTYELTLAPGESKSILAFHLAGDSIEDGPNAYMMNLSQEIVDSVDSMGLGSPYLTGLNLVEFNSISNWP
ncbi:Ig-like domain-containing protein [Myxococcota bacterium]|nr:Ig-like domain-containing protein [Myxococcota bacterium]